MQDRAYWWFRCLVGLVLGMTVNLLTGWAAAGSGGVLVLRVDGAIGPATVDYLHRGLRQAAAVGSNLVVLELDTPGGLDSSMRAIIKDMLASTVPVATYVAPEGARAASAGTYILYASHVAAMAPATNLGAATPVAIGFGGGSSNKPDAGSGTASKPKAESAADSSGGQSGATPRREEATPSATPSPVTKTEGGDAMAAKSIEDASAYIRGLAQLRGRNVDFAVRAVREAASLSSEEALAQKVIEYIAVDLPALLVQLDGREVGVLHGTNKLATVKAKIERFEPDWRNRMLAVLANPQVALVLMMIGIYGLFFEFTSPGFGVPGVAGAISLLMALYAFQLLPVNWAGVLLLAVGTGLMLAEVFVPSFGVLGIGGIVAFIVGGLFLMDTGTPGFGIPLPLIVGLAIATAAVVLAIGGFAARSAGRPVVSGRESMIGTCATVIGQTDDGQWWVHLQGERWRARSQQPLRPGDGVRVERVDGLTVEVVAIPDSSTFRRTS